MSLQSITLMLWSPTIGPNRGFLEEAARNAVADGWCALTDNPAEATVILVSEIDPRRPLASEEMRTLYRTKSDRLFFFSTDDRACPWIPGIYASIERKMFIASRMRAGFYPLHEPSVLHVPDVIGSEPYLACFTGAVTTHPVRRYMLTLKSPRFLISDTSNHPARLGTAAAAEQDTYTYANGYGQALSKSLFGLCPRGNGTSSVRLFECMAAGRAPVIISDDWEEPSGPDWLSFSVRVPENDVGRIEERLADLQPRAREMGALARRAYQRWFGTDHALETLIHGCMEIQSARSMGERWHRLLALSYFRHPFYIRHHLKPFIADRLSSIFRSMRNG